MGQILHEPQPRTLSERQYTDRRLRSKKLAARYGLNWKTVAKWRKHSFLHDAPQCAALRKHTLLPFSDCRYTLKASISPLTRYALLRCFQRHGINRRPEIDGGKPPKNMFR